MTNKAGDDRPGIAEALANINGSQFDLDSIARMRKTAGLATIGEYPNISALSSAIGTVSRQRMENSGMANLSKIVGINNGAENPHWDKLMKSINGSISGSFIAAVQKRAERIDTSDPAAFVEQLTEEISGDIDSGRVPQLDLSQEEIDDIEEAARGIVEWAEANRSNIAKGAKWTFFAGLLTFSASTMSPVAALITVVTFIGQYLGEGIQNQILKNGN